MKTFSLSRLISFSALIMGLTAIAAPPALTPEATKQVVPGEQAVYRLWHDVQGRTVDATFRGIEGENVFLQTKDGYVHRLPLNRLIPEDLAVARKLKPEGLGIPADPNVAKAAQKIDEIVAMGLKSAKQEPNALASDEQFVRRVYLDLAGRVPTRDETMAFLADTSSSKRAKVIDKLVSSDGFNSRMFDYFSDMLRMTDDAQKAKFFTYEEWFKEQLRQNRPWDKIVHEMMTADGKLLENGATGYLLRDKGMRLDNLSLTLSTFLGANVSCAQCHDHPFADWTQRQFYEMAAFFGETDTYKTKGSAKGAYGNMRKELTPEELKRAKKLFLANALTVTDGNANEVKLPDDYKYKDGKPGDEVLPKLVMWSAEDKKLPIYAMADAALKNGSGKEDLRETFATWMTSPQNPRFAITIANRLWKLVFGVAAKEPVTDLDNIADSANPLLLTHLGEEMKRLNFDVRAFMRLLCNTQTYQREAITKEINPGEPYYFPGPVLRRMTSEQAWDSCVTLAIGDKVDDYKIKRAEAYASVMNLSDQVTAEDIRTKLASMGRVAGKNAGAGAPKNAKNNKRKMMMQSEGDDVDHTRPSVMDGLVLARASELPQPEKEQHFLRMFGQSDRQIADSNSDEGSIPQVLMLMNGEAQSVLRNPRSLVLSTSINMKTPEQQVESLYYSFFSRKPTAAELTEATQALSNGLTVSDLTWVLFNTREFVFVQ